MKALNFLASVILCFIFCTANAQFFLDAELRPRAEYRHGYSTIFPEDQQAAFLVSQRTRLNAYYKTQHLETYLSFQNVRIWGDTPQLSNDDKNGIAIWQAWTKLHFKKGLSFKIGRQLLTYDDLRFYGNSNWKQQGRVHDAALLKLEKESYQIDLALAYNQSEEQLVDRPFATPNQYKTLQLLRFYKPYKNFTASLSFLNLGNQFINEEEAEKNDTFYSQTIGSHITYKKDKFKIKANLYGQFGKDVVNNKLNAYYYALTSTYKIEKGGLKLGFENMSGNKEGEPSSGYNNAFTPFFGNNHLYNGFMDYFFVGNHRNNIGLIDVYGGMTYSVLKNTKIDATIHNFSGAKEMTIMNGKQLGVEVDLVLNHQLMNTVSAALGYSHMFANDNLKLVKGINSGATNNFIWTMITIKPKLFTTNKESDL